MAALSVFTMARNGDPKEQTTERVVSASQPTAPAAGEATNDSDLLAKSEAAVVAAPPGIRLLRSGHAVDCVIFSEDGRRLYAGGGDRITIWDTDDWTLVNHVTIPDEYRQHHRISALAVSHDGRQVAWGTWYAGHYVWSVNEGGMALHIPPSTGHPWHVLSLSFSPDSALLASGGSEGTVKVWDVETGELQHRFEVDRMHVLDVHFSEDGRLLGCVTGSMSSSYRCLYEVSNASRGVLIYDLWRDKLLLELPGPTKGMAPATVTFDEEDQCLYAAPWGEKAAAVVDLKADPSLEFVGDDRAWWLALSTDGSLGVGVTGQSIWVERLKDGVQLASCDLPKTDDTVSSIGFSPDSRVIAVGLGSLSLKRDDPWGLGVWNWSASRSGTHEYRGSTP